MFKMITRRFIPVLFLFLLIERSNAGDIEGWWGDVLEQQFSSVSVSRVRRQFGEDVLERIKSELSGEFSNLQQTFSNVIEKSLALIYNAFGEQLKQLNETMQQNNDAILKMLAELQNNQKIIFERLDSPPVTYTDCEDIFKNNNNSRTGVYPINPDGQGEFNVVCDMKTDGGGWTVIQSRQVNDRPAEIGSDFYRNWTDYESGFGNIDEFSNFWLGLEKIYRLTAQGDYQLRIDIDKQIADKNEKGAALYRNFSIGNASELYRLNLGEYVNNYYDTCGVREIGDALSFHNGLNFSTPDQDNDGYGPFNCAKYVTFGGWWYIGGICLYADLNGQTAWQTFDGTYGTLSRTKMMIRSG